MTNAKAQMIKTDVVAGFILALLMGTMWAGTRPAPTTEINNYLVLGICLAIQGGQLHAAPLLLSATGRYATVTMLACHILIL